MEFRRGRNMRQIFHRTIHELREMLRSGELTSASLTRLYLERIARFDGKNGLNTIAELDPTAVEQANAADHRSAEGLLAGIPVLIKDNIDVKGLHTTAGSLALKDHVAKEDAPVVAALRRAGAVILGKTNMTEFANFTTQGMPGGYSSLGGQVYHAYDRGRNPSGSSTGSAVAVSAGFCSAAIGTDTSFSVVGCATEHGICGYKPPIGVLSQKGIIPIAHTLDSAGILARDMRDVLLVYSALREIPLEEAEPVRPEELRIAINISRWNDVSEAQRQRYRVFRARLEKAGVRFTSVDQPFTPMLRQIMIDEFAADLEKYLASAGDAPATLAEIAAFYQADPARMKYGISHLLEALEAANDPDSFRYREALEERERLRDSLRAELAESDACMITGPTNVCHFAGLPSVSVPFCMAEDGSPRSVILYGVDEKRLLSAALTLESFADPILPPELPKPENEPAQA